ncbi:hypothetical protein PGT21_036657 [Puccinia graminis f. sp. tritici]|uniref:Uncharacterized protein n=1 Tax=Puccinia graminis f. sp. tritici TaxID=56615 RepID=A0A5B0Q095_PUCGR|nr:hypothetical protein PGT21_036657 [Puccinia graminis f. sp. tritici]KAA1126180.1 hypothetical protein PGTUg99_007840 [Puccinia graminis f. sp. tritici]
MVAHKISLWLCEDSRFLEEWQSAPTLNPLLLDQRSVDDLPVGWRRASLQGVCAALDFCTGIHFRSGRISKIPGVPGEQGTAFESCASIASQSFSSRTVRSKSHSCLASIPRPANVVTKNKQHCHLEAKLDIDGADKYFQSIAISATHRIFTPFS